jgi:salicylate hydroxylase
MDESISATSLEPTGIDLYPAKAERPLVTLELGAAIRAQFGSPYVVMHRADLAAVLHRACRRFANIDIQFNVHTWSAQSNEKDVTLSWEQEGALQQTGRALALIGADGVHSQTRTTLVGGGVAQYRGRVAWRVLLPEQSLAGSIALDRVSVLFGPDYHLVCYPLPHRAAVNVALFVAGSAAPADAGSGPELRKPGDSRLRTILAAAEHRWAPWPLYSVQMPSWHSGNIGVIGDAAHAMVPFQAQGAAMGIEDAAVLAPLLISERDPETAFKRYESLRQPRVRRVARTSLANGTIFHLGWPLSIARNLVIAAQGPRGHLRRLSWLYGYDAQGALGA